MRTKRHQPLTMRTVSASVLAGLTMLSSAACGDVKVEVRNGPSTPTVPADTLADKAAEAIGKEVGQEAQADCGDEPINVVEGNVIHCKLGPASDPSVVYDATVTLSDVDGTDFHLDVENSQHTIDPEATLPPPSK
jgi:hypothetical protein